MTKQEAIEILKKDVACRKIPTCPDDFMDDTSCDNCKYSTDYNALTHAMETAIAIMEGSVKS